MGSRARGRRCGFTRGTRLSAFRAIPEDGVLYGRPRRMICLGGREVLFMSSARENVREERRMLPGAAGASNDNSALPVQVRQLQELPKDELAALAEEFGLDPSSYATAQHIV